MSARDLRLKVERRLKAAGVQLGHDQVEQLCAYFGLLAKWNRRLNLTGFKLESADVDPIDRLLVEPAVAAQSIAASDSLLVDLGSGGGSPAVPLKICAPHLGLVMVEVKVRKAAFLRDVVRQLALKPVEVANARFEELLPRSDLHEAASIVSVRAVRADQKLWGPTHAFLRPGGRLFWFSSTASVEPGRDSGLTIEAVKPLPGSGQLVIFSKPA